MQFPKDQRVVLALGAGAAVLAGVVIAAVAMGGRDKTPEPPPASKGGLQVSVDEAPTLDVTRNLRCYVNGQFVGEATLAECARRNGVSAQALDVGLDESGALVAAETASLAPPPPAPMEVLPEPTAPVDVPAAEPVAPAQPAEAAGPTAPCLRHVGAEWRQLSDAVSLNSCVQMLFAGHCERPGGAAYGRWGDTTLRLVPKRVERSSDNKRFSTLVEQGANCSIPQIR